MPRASASKKTALASEQARPDVARKRARWKARQGSIDLTRLVFLDESEPLKAPLVRAQWRTAKTNMAPLRGWAAKGKRLIGHAPFGHWIEGLTAIGSRATPRADLRRRAAP